jgi:hypothetical protein
VLVALPRQAGTLEFVLVKSPDEFGVEPLYPGGPWVGLHADGERVGQIRVNDCGAG